MYMYKKNKNITICLKDMGALACDPNVLGISLW